MPFFNSKLYNFPHKFLIVKKEIAETKSQMTQLKFAKPFLKWAGGKTQLINDIKNTLPQDLEVKNFTYIEPFVGSGAILFWMVNNFPSLKKAIINDINKDLINTYKVIANDPHNLIALLTIFQTEFHALEENPTEKKEYYYKKRTCYNHRKEKEVVQAALFIFLNKTCFNGLYRVNRKNEFNVPIGSYKKPKICDEKNILAVHKVLQKVEILSGDYRETLQYADENSFFYFDPPYKPLNSTSNFNTYTKEEFGNEEQIRLRDFCRNLDQKRYRWMLSNSDVKEADLKDSFFDELYADYFIKRVQAKRSINANPHKRGKLNELLITNY